jgi:hypothetical protein
MDLILIMIVTLMAIQFWLLVLIIGEIAAIKSNINVIIMNSHRDRNIIIDAIKD